MSREVTAALALTAALRGKLPPTIQIFFFLSLVFWNMKRSRTFFSFSICPLRPSTTHLCLINGMEIRSRGDRFQFIWTRSRIFRSAWEAEPSNNRLLFSLKTLERARLNHIWTSGSFPGWCGRLIWAWDQASVAYQKKKLEYNGVFSVFGWHPASLFFSHKRVAVVGSHGLLSSVLLGLLFLAFSGCTHTHTWRRLYEKRSWTCRPNDRPVAHLWWFTATSVAVFMRVTCALASRLL